MGKFGPVAVQPSFGWVLSGRMEKNRGISAMSTTVASHVMAIPVDAENNERLDHLVQKFWDLDSVISPVEIECC